MDCINGAVIVVAFSSGEATPESIASSAIGSSAVMAEMNTRSVNGGLCNSLAYAEVFVEKQASLHTYQCDLTGLAGEHTKSNERRSRLPSRYITKVGSGER